jgi:large subunit ribosomal protein L22
MEAAVSGKFLRVSLKKVMPLADIIRGQAAVKAVTLLQFRPQKAAKLLLKVLNSSIAAAKEKNAEIDKLVVKKVIVNKAIYLKRQLPVSKGTAHLIKKPTSHIYLTLSDETKEKENPKSDPSTSSGSPRAKSRGATRNLKQFQMTKIKNSKV